MDEDIVTKAFDVFKKRKDIEIKVLLAFHRVCKFEKINRELDDLVLKHKNIENEKISILRNKSITNYLSAELAKLIVKDYSDIDQLRYLAEHAENGDIRFAAKNHPMMEKWNKLYEIVNIKENKFNRLH